MINKEYFKLFWQKNYNDIPPIGFVLREYFINDRWFRIHSLPNSKRYAENDDETKIILDRQNSLITDLIGEQNHFLLLLSAFSETPTLDCFSEVEDAIALDSIRLDKALPENYDTECYLHIAIINKLWTIGSIDGCLKAVANEEPIIETDSCDIYCCLIIDVEQNRIIAPYDGGVDLFLNITQERDYFKSKYNAWLSSTESGL